jgi:hypothetical protein
MSRRERARELIGASLTWKRAGKGWRLFDGKRKFGEVIPDSKHRGMWRCVLSGDRLSDLANLSWARHAVLESAVRELEYEARQDASRDPSFTGQLSGVFQPRSSHSDLTAADHAEAAL